MPWAQQMLGAAAAAVWGAPMTALLAGTHVFLTVRLGFIQRFLPRALRLSVTRENGGRGDFSPLAALSTSLAATIGTGNIVGVAAAVAAGGPGAVFWMWISGIFGMATKYTEALICVKYRVTLPDGTTAGGPMYVMERRLNAKGMGRAFAFFTALAALGIGGMVQSNSASGMLSRLTGAPPALFGAVCAVAAACVLAGGAKNITRVCAAVIPAAGAAFIICNLAVLAVGWRTLPASLLLILRTAFTGAAPAAGFMGAAAKDAVRCGVARGLFSNESGLGSSPIVDAGARTGDPVRQALVSSTGPFWDTVVLAALTGLMMVNTGAWLCGSDSGGMAYAAFSALPFGGAVLAASLFIFACATETGWFFYAQRAVEYLRGGGAVAPYRALYILLIFAGSFAPVAAVWSFCDIFNALMALPNLLCVLLLSGEAACETRERLGRRRFCRGARKAPSRRAPRASGRK
jgi:AGCS family alanine or glycine:cation symporter